MTSGGGAAFLLPLPQGEKEANGGGGRVNGVGNWLLRFEARAQESVGSAGRSPTVVFLRGSKLQHLYPVGGKLQTFFEIASCHVLVLRIGGADHPIQFCEGHVDLPILRLIF